MDPEKFHVPPPPTEFSSSTDGDYLRPSQSGGFPPFETIFQSNAALVALRSEEDGFVAGKPTNFVVGEMTASSDSQHNVQRKNAGDFAGDLASG